MSHWDLIWECQGLKEVIFRLVWRNSTKFGFESEWTELYSMSDIHFTNQNHRHLVFYLLAAQIYKCLCCLCMRYSRNYSSADRTLLSLILTYLYQQFSKYSLPKLRLKYLIILFLFVFALSYSWKINWKMSYYHQKVLNCFKLRRAFFIGLNFN